MSVRRKTLLLKKKLKDTEQHTVEKYLGIVGDSSEIDLKVSGSKNIRTLITDLVHHGSLSLISRRIYHMKGFSIHDYFNLLTKGLTNQTQPEGDNHGN